MHDVRLKHVSDACRMSVLNDRMVVIQVGDRVCLEDETKAK